MAAEQGARKLGEDLVPARAHGAQVAGAGAALVCLVRVGLVLPGAVRRGPVVPGSVRPVLVHRGPTRLILVRRAPAFPRGPVRATWVRRGRVIGQLRGTVDPGHPGLPARAAAWRIGATRVRKGRRGGDGDVEAVAVAVGRAPIGRSTNWRRSIPRPWSASGAGNARAGPLVAISCWFTSSRTPPRSRCWKGAR